MDNGAIVNNLPSETSWKGLHVLPDQARPPAPDPVFTECASSICMDENFVDILPQFCHANLPPLSATPQNRATRSLFKLRQTNRLAPATRHNIFSNSLTALLFFAVQFLTTKFLIMTNHLKEKNTGRNDPGLNKESPSPNNEPKRIGNIPSPMYPERRKELMDDYEERENLNQSAEYPKDDIDREDIDRDTDAERYFLNSDIDRSFMNSRFYPDRSSFRNQPPYHRR